MAKQLADIAAETDQYPKQVEIKEERLGPDLFFELTTGDPTHAGMMRAAVQMVNGEPKAAIEGVWAGTKKRGEATRLMQALILTLQQRGVHELWSYTLTSDALKFREKFFGEDALHFYDSQHPENGFLPLTVDQAIATAEQIEKRNRQDRHAPSNKFGVVVDLDRVDSSGWTAPTPSTEPMLDLEFADPVFPASLSIARENDDDDLRQAA